MTYTTDQHTHSPRWCYLLRHVNCLVIFGYIKAYLNRLYSHNICHVIISGFMYSSHLHMWRSFVCVGYHVGEFHVRELSCGGVSCAWAIMWRSFMCVSYHVGEFHVRELSCWGVSGMWAIMWGSIMCVSYHVEEFHVRELSCGRVSCSWAIIWGSFIQKVIP